MNKLKHFYYRLVRKYPSLTLKNLGIWAFRLGAAGVLLVSFLFIFYSYKLPDPNKLLSRQVPESTQILAKDGTLLYEVHGEVNRSLVNLDQIPENLQHATIAVEDKDFYTHSGVSITGILRSVIIDVLSGKKKQGGSTITQQFVKNAVLTNEKAFSRKVKEIILSIEIEARFSKDDILKLYLNEIPYGRNAYGIEAASRTYFNKSAKDLTLAESAYLAALPQAPTYYNPFGPHRDALDSRKDVILSLMREQGYITEQQEQEAKQSEVAFNPIKSSIIAPHFVFYVESYLADTYGEEAVQEGGLKVYTTLDTKLQNAAETAVRENLAKYGNRYNAHNASLVAIDPKTGQILAMVGGKDYFGDSEPKGCVPGKSCQFEPNVNIATSNQQPGSSFKPFVYVTAFGKDYNYSPSTMLMDVVTNFGNFGGRDYTPRNFNGGEYGPVSMRQALAGSLNIPAVKTLSLVGVDSAVETARKLGITTPLENCGLSLVLGGCEVKLVDHTASYSVLANGGKKNEKTAILKVVDSKGTVLEEFKQNETQVLDPQAVYQLTSIMTDNNARSFIFGSSSPLTLPGRLVAAKTGTTNDFKDGWTMGFTPSLTAGVWVGNNNNDPLKADAVVVAGPIWNAFMRAALKDTPAEEFTVPSGISKISVDTISGKLPTELTPSTKSEVFADYNKPENRDDVHIGVKIDSLTGLPATNDTPQDQITTKIYTVLHSERPDNPAWENPVRAWAIAHGYEYPPEGSQYTNDGPGDNSDPNAPKPEVSITNPSDGATITSSSFTINASAESGSGIARVDIAIDGEVINSLTAKPYSITVNKKYSDGKHTISVRAVNGEGVSNATSIDITIAGQQSLIIIKPIIGQTNIKFPLELVAQSQFNFDVVTFYYQTGLSQKNIGIGEQTLENDGTTTYATLWDKPKKGSYKVFAKTDTGITSSRITVLVP